MIPSRYLPYTHAKISDEFIFKIFAETLVLSLNAGVHKVPGASEVRGERCGDGHRRLKGKNKNVCFCIVSVLDFCLYRWWERRD